MTWFECLLSNNKRALEISYGPTWRLAQLALLTIRLSQLVEGIRRGEEHK